jgi:hypothetical protein
MPMKCGGRDKLLKECLECLNSGTNVLYSKRSFLRMKIRKMFAVSGFLDEFVNGAPELRSFELLVSKSVLETYFLAVRLYGWRYFFKRV